MSESQNILQTANVEWSTLTIKLLKYMSDKYKQVSSVNQLVSQKIKRVLTN